MVDRSRQRVVHLTDDTTAGGVMRVIDHITRGSGMDNDAEHTMRHVQRAQVSFQKIEADVIVSHLSISWRTLPSLVALRLRHANAKLIHVEHSYTEGFVRHNVRNPRRFFALLRIGFGLFDRIVAVSATQEAWFLRSRLKSEDKLHLIRSYADLTPFLELPQRTGKIRHLAAIGRLDHQKGFDLLIAAFCAAKDPDLRLSIYGVGEQEGMLRILAKGDERIRFEGFAKSPTSAYQDIDAVIMPSRWEAYGLVAIEALSAGCELFCRDVDGLRDHARFGAQLFEDDNFDFGALSSADALDSRSTSYNRGQLVQQLAAENNAGWKGVCQSLR